MGMSEETKDNIAKWVFNGILGGGAFLAVVGFIILYTVVLPDIREDMREREATKYEREPVIQCVDGIKYVSLFDDTANVTVKIDPETLQPERCTETNSNQGE